MIGAVATTPAPAPRFEIVTPRQQKAYFHPVRMRILNFLTHEPLTISHVAGRLKVHPANITHHFRVLRGAGLIRLVEARDTGRVVEKYYAAAAPVFDVRPPEGTVKHVNQTGLSFLRDDLAANITQLKRDDSDEVVGLIERARIDSRTLRRFAKRLRDLIADFEGSACGDGTIYCLNVSLYPHHVDYGPIGKYVLKKPRRTPARRRP